MQQTDGLLIRLSDRMEAVFRGLTIPAYMMANFTLAIPWVWSVAWQNRDIWQTILALTCPITGTFCVAAAYWHGREVGAQEARRRVVYRYIQRGTKAERKEKERLMSSRRYQFSKVKEARRLALIERDGYVCRHCGSQENLEIDHIVPLSKGGSDGLKNLQFLCPSCNRSKNDRL